MARLGRDSSHAAARRVDFSLIAFHRIPALVTNPTAAEEIADRRDSSKRGVVRRFDRRNSLDSRDFSVLADSTFETAGCRRGS
jgi:hypothetical protein